MSRGPDIGTMLTRAIERDARAAGCAVEIVTADWEHWASATFSGARHTLTLHAAPSPALEMWIAGLPEAEIDLRGHLLADLTVASLCRTEENVTVAIEALTVAQ